MMDFTLTAEQRHIAAMVRALMEEKVGPRAQEIDEKAEFPVWVADLFRELDIFAVVIPEEYGGVDGSLVTLCAVQEQIARIVPACSMILGVQGLGSTPVVLFGSEEQKRRWLPDFATGEKMTGFGLTEPNAGSDVKAMTTRASRVEGGWRLNGRKCFISHANIADVVVMFAKVRDDTGDRITAFLVETDQPGYTVDKIERKMGLRGSTTCSLVLEDAWVPDENLLGEVGQGLDVLLATLHKSRIGSAAQSLGVAQGALDIAAAHVQQRTQFGHPPAHMPTVQLIVGGMIAQVEASRALIYAAAGKYDQGAPTRELQKFSALAKLFAGDAAMRVATDAVQIMGGYGYCAEYGAERFMRDAKVFQIFEGANELHQMQAARLLFATI